MLIDNPSLQNAVGDFWYADFAIIGFEFFIVKKLIKLMGFELKVLSNFK